MRAWILASLILVSIAHAGDSSDPALDRLAKVDLFAFGGTGFAGVISRGERDYRVIMSRPSAEVDFEKLFAVGNAQAKLYALVGIRTLDRSRFQRISGPLRNSAEEVVTQHGCIVDHEPFRAVLQQIEAGNFSVYSGAKATSPEPGIAP
jgi:hypothetical protein